MTDIITRLIVKLFLTWLEWHRICNYELTGSAKVFVPSIVAGSIVAASILATLLYVLRDMASTQRRLSSRSSQDSNARNVRAWLDNTVETGQNEAVSRNDPNLLRPPTTSVTASRRTSRGSRSSMGSLNPFNGSAAISVPSSTSGWAIVRQRINSSNDEVFYDAEATLSRKKRKKGHGRTYSFAKALARVRDSFKKVDDEFECPICFEQMNPPKKIFQCAQGHVICQDCQRKVLNSLCPTCRGPLTGRNVAMEKLADSYFGSMAFDECPVPDPDSSPEPTTTPEPETTSVLTTEL